jgi:SlyX protein
VEDRLERLESERAMQDRSLEKLNDVIYSQQKQIDAMEEQIEALITVVRELKDSVGSGVLPRDEPPPHYGR